MEVIAEWDYSWRECHHVDWDTYQIGQSLVLIGGRRSSLVKPKCVYGGQLIRTSHLISNLILARRTMPMKCAGVNCPVGGPFICLGCP